MYHNGNIINSNSMEMLEYIEMDDTDEFSSARSRNSIYYASNKIKMKAALALIRVIMLYIFFYLDNKNMTVFLSNLVAFLLAHEALVISNFILMSGYFIFNRIMNRTNTLLPSFFLYLDILNNIIFFTWFVYGNLVILTDRQGLDESLTRNKTLTYYITIIILMGFFIYSKLVFYVIFFVSFCPCITYVLCFDLHEDYKKSRRAARLQSKLQEVDYEEYKSRTGYDLDMCIICANEFNSKSKVICLPCNDKHTFHSECIRKWLEKKTICPLCRVDLHSREDNI